MAAGETAECVRCRRNTVGAMAADDVRQLKAPQEQRSSEAVCNSDTSRPEDIMNRIAISFAVGACALFATTVNAAPLIADRSVAPDSNIQNVRMVCNENGSCWREHRDRHVIVRDSYGSDAPRERYIERRGYEERGGTGFRTPGVSVGIGTDRY